MNQTSSEAEATQPVVDSAPKQRHPLAGVLTAIAVALSVLTVAVLGLGVVVLVRTAPAAVGPSKSVTVTVTSNYAYGVVTYTRSSTTEVSRIEPLGTPKVWRPEVAFGDAVVVTIELISTSADDPTGAAGINCAITSADGSVNVSSSTTVTGGRAQCSWANNKAS
ncbi:MAG: hypothetical protein L6256_10285 [Propionicimonas sp.]|uniref:hypothetical protein n=1 Tax=Propionicimonas sp. TaxID=1955623 RepID=UPI001DA9E32B|nr:hypothetical protein [Propionicimonas sp.]MBU4186786.1 hypothetical protein [Actinomycetota bacterium]MBU4206106.1 hypothetical protein [Actinomycetota bacterium]MBU4249949.1 hypothetical protein [Actinomycetota bacterium]MBU4410244.1 hypothetical protein [Actinomycetota bacterium]MBU4587559.1 hypothetical protein [Actinomycetota bacterium]